MHDLGQRAPSGAVLLLVYFRDGADASALAHHYADGCLLIMRILVLANEFPSAGHPRGIFILRCSEALRNLGHEIEVVRVVPYAPPLYAKWRYYRSIPSLEDVAGFAVHTIRAIMAPRMIALEHLPMQVDAALRREIKRFRPDVLHANCLIPSGQIAVRHGVPTVLTAHGSDAYRWPFSRPGLHRAAKEAIVGATQVTAVSGYIAQCVQKIAMRDVHVIWNGGDERFFFPHDRQESRVRLGLPQDRFVIVYVGHVMRGKGLFDLVEAVGAMARCRPLIAIAGGEANDAAELREVAGNRAVDLRILGWLDSKAVGELVGAADVVTLPSYAEGMPNVVCEAMLSGRPVVATTVGGIPEVIIDGRTGLLVPPRRPDLLGRALERLADDNDLRESIAHAARAFAVTHLTWSVIALRYNRVFEETVSVAAKTPDAR